MVHGKQKTKRRILKILRIEAKFHKAKPERKSGRYQFLSGRILAGLLVKEPKTRKNGPSMNQLSGSFSFLNHHFLQVKSSLKIPTTPVTIDRAKL